MHPPIGMSYLIAKYAAHRSGTNVIEATRAATSATRTMTTVLPVSFCSQAMWESNRDAYTSRTRYAVTDGQPIAMSEHIDAVGQPRDGMNADADSDLPSSTASDPAIKGGTNTM